MTRTPTWQLKYFFVYLLQMNSIRNIIRKEVKKLVLESDFKDNYGLPPNFNLLFHAEQLEKDKTRAEKAIGEIENVVMQEFNSNEKKLIRIKDILKNW